MKLEKKLDHDHSNKYITSPEFNKVTAVNFSARLKQTNLASKSEVADFVKDILMKNFKIRKKMKIISNKTKLALLKIKFAQVFLLVKVSSIMMDTILFNSSTNLQNYYDD